MQQRRKNISKNLKSLKTITSDSVGHHPGVQFQKERLQLAQPALLLLLFLLTVPAFLVHSQIFSLLVLPFFDPGYPGSIVLTGIGSWVIGREINRHGCLVVVGESGQQPLNHIWSLVCQIPPLARVSCDVEQPHVFEGGGFVERRVDTFKVPPGTRESGKYLRSKIYN